MGRRPALLVLAVVLVVNVLGASILPDRVFPASGSAFAAGSEAKRMADPYPPVPEYSGTVTLFWDSQVYSPIHLTTRSYTGSATLRAVRGDTVRTNDPPNGLEFALEALSSQSSETGGTKSCSWTHTPNPNAGVDGLIEPISFYTRPSSWLTTLNLRGLSVIATGQCTGEEPQTFLDTVDLEGMVSQGIDLVNQADAASARYRILSDTSANGDGGTRKATVRAVVDLQRLDPASPHSQYPTVQVTANVPPPDGFDPAPPGWAYDKVTIRSNPPVAGADVRQSGERGPVRGMENLSVAGYPTAVTDRNGVFVRVELRDTSEFPPCYSAQIFPHNGQTVAGQSAIACAGDGADPAATKGRTKLVEKFKASYPKSAAYRGKVIVKDSTSNTPTGKVVLRRGKVVVGKGVIRSGQASFTLRRLKKGTNKLTATYAGDSRFTASRLRFAIIVR